MLESSSTVNDFDEAQEMMLCLQSKALQTHSGHWLLLDMLCERWCSAPYADFLSSFLVQVVPSPSMSPFLPPSLPSSPRKERRKEGGAQSTTEIKDQFTEWFNHSRVFGTSSPHAHHLWLRALLLHIGYSPVSISHMAMHAWVQKAADSDTSPPFRQPILRIWFAEHFFSLPSQGLGIGPDAPSDNAWHSCSGTLRLGSL